jgi:hypothetical protein
VSELPRRINVKEVLESRYLPGERPTLWGDRRQGVEIVTDENGENIALLSSGGQPTPAIGWQLLLTKTVSVDNLDGLESAHVWTLYGV